MPWTIPPNGQRPNDNGPWGQPPRRSPPDLEDLIRRFQASLGRFLPGRGLGGTGIFMLALVGIIVWALSGFYTVSPNEVGLNLVFGAYRGKTGPGLNYNWPFPIGSIEKLAVTDRNATDVGQRVIDDPRRGGVQTTGDPAESLMLTGDENIADVKFRVIWQIDLDHPENFAFNLRNPSETVKAVAESAMREIVGRTQIQRILTAERKLIEPAAQDLMQRILNEYKAGVLVLQVQLLSVDPPAEVIAAFRDVTAAQQDLQRQRNDAESYANRVVPEARGAAARITQEAEGYRQQVVAEARGQASRFDQIYDSYKGAPELTRQRMYLETMEKLLGGMDKTIIDMPPGTVLPFLPLPGAQDGTGGLPK